MVSIIIPNYNHEIFLQERLKSVFNQTFQDFEVILLDDASSDNSLNILDQYRDHSKLSHFIVNKVNSGSPFKQWQKGIILAKGEYIWIAESDDYCELDFLEKIFEFKNTASIEVGLIYTQSIDVDENSRPLANRIKYTEQFEPNIWETDFNISGREFVEKFLKVKNVIPNASAVLFKRSLVSQQIFSKDMLEMKMCGDWLFWIKICSKTDVGFLSKPLNHFRSHRSMSRNHRFKEKKIDRLIEEAVIRRYLKKIDVSQKLEKDKLLRKWFKLHAKTDVIKRGFFRIESGSYAYFHLIKKYLLYKLNARKHA